MTLKIPTIILFDMDGTTVRHINPELLSVLEFLDDMSHKIGKFFSKCFNRKIKPPSLVSFRDGKRQKLLVHRALHRMRNKTIDQIVEPCPGIYDLLDLLKDNNIRLGIISNGLGKGYGHDILSTFDLERYFDVKIFREDIKRAKPHPDPILQALEQLSPKPNSKDVIWFIGDRQKDIFAALAARDHIKSELEPFAYNMHAAIAILKHGISPDHIIMAWPDIESKLRVLLKE